MIFTLRIAHWRFTFTIAPVTNIIGVNSTLPDGNHIVMWDFDNYSLNIVAYSLRQVQVQFNLPPIYILNTGTPNHFIAYCFEAMLWENSVMIVASTPRVDPSFFKYGVYRERWTLRVSKKEGRKPQLVRTLKSIVSETASIDELNSWVQVKTCTMSLPRLHIMHGCLDGFLGMSTSFSHLGITAQNTRRSPITRQ